MQNSYDSAQFKLFYQQYIHPLLLVLESDRIKQYRLILLLALSGVFLAIYLTSVQIWMFTFFGLFLFVFTLFFVYYRIIFFRIKIKSSIINELVKFIKEEKNYLNLHYQPNGSIHKDVIRHSQIYSNLKHLNGEDYFNGSIDQSNFQFSEIGIKTEKWSSQYNFNGCLIHIQSPTIKKGNILATPQKYKHLYAKSIKNHIRLGAKPLPIVTNKKEELWTVYMSKVEENNPTYHTDIEQLIDAIQWLEKYKVIFSKYDNEIFISIDNVPNLFEPKWWKPLTNFENVEQYLKELTLILNTIEEINQIF